MRCHVDELDVVHKIVSYLGFDVVINFVNLAALLSVVAEQKPLLAWKIGIDGLLGVLEVAREHGCAVFTPSSIGSFGPTTPQEHTPQDTIQRPKTIYGITSPCPAAAPPTMRSTSTTTPCAASASCAH